MKKMILAATMLLMAGMTGAFAEKGDEVNQQVVKSFKKEFASAQNVSWEQHKEYVKTVFSINGQYFLAYYNNNGELQSIMRNILTDQLPLNLLTQLKKGYADYWVTELFEVAAGGTTSYFMTLENADQKLVLKSDSGTGYSWSVSGKELKSAE